MITDLSMTAWSVFMDSGLPPRLKAGVGPRNDAESDT